MLYHSYDHSPTLNDSNVKLSAIKNKDRDEMELLVRLHTKNLNHDGNCSSVVNHILVQNTLQEK